jgi:poly(A) polymerase Pap1
MKHYSFEEIVELAKTEPRKQLRLHWEGEQKEAKEILAAHIVADVADGMYSTKEFDDMGYCVSEEDYQEEQAEADYQSEE